MFNPTQADVRRFFCAVHAKTLQQQPMEAIETLASQWIAEHPEYHAELSDVDAALERIGEPGTERDNPFLHLSMHLSISEQCSIDQPPGIRQAVELLTARRDDLHAAHHEVMECLGTMLWESQRAGRPPDGQAYIEQVCRRATQD
jgi:Domain of unknown function (DUF1841)